MSPTKVKTDIFDKTRNHMRTEQLRWARENDLLPYFRPVQSKVSPLVDVDGRNVVMLGSNCYLGLTSDPRVLAAAQAALETYGTGLTGSRLLNGTTPLHEELEAEIAQWYGSESALVFSTGYQANLGCISALAGPGDAVVCDQRDHASIHHGCKLSGADIFKAEHGSLQDFEAKLEAASHCEGGILAVFDSVYSMHGEIAPLDQLVELCSNYGARVLVDEAHAVGVFGATGTGTVELFGLEDQVDMRMGTFSKSLASCGGFIAATEDVIDYMRFASGPFLFTASAVPAALGAALAAIRICRSEEGRQLSEKVLDNARYLNQGLAELGFTVNQAAEIAGKGELVSPIVPVLIGDDIKAVLFWNALFKKGVYGNSAVYPSVPKDGAVMRLSVMATHEHSHLDRAIEVFAEVSKDFPEVLSL